MTRVTRKGQATIPKEVREFLRLGAGSEVEFVIRDREVVVMKRDPEEREKERKLRQFRDHLQSVRGTGASGMTTDEIMEMTRGPFDDVDSR